MPAPNHTVAQGECINSIAFDAGIPKKTLWNANRGRLEGRTEYVLCEGDEIFVPSPEDTPFMAVTDKLHVFEIGGSVIPFELKVVWQDQPVVNKEYEFYIDGEIKDKKDPSTKKKIPSVTDGAGWVRHGIRSNAETGKVVINLVDDEDEEFELEINIEFGKLDPIESNVKTAKARLNHLDYEVDDSTDDLDEQTVGVLKLFQEDNEIPITGALDAPTLAKLSEKSMNNKK